jgi:hypothetical protein
MLLFWSAKNPSLTKWIFPFERRSQSFFTKAPTVCRKKNSAKGIIEALEK